MRTLMRFVILLAASFQISCSETPAKQDGGIIISEDNSSGQSNTQTKENNNSKSDADITKEAITAAVDLTKTVIKTIKINDSIKMANREQMFAYQIGLPIRHEDQLFEIYKKLNTIEAVYVLQKSHKEFYLVKYEGKSQTDLETELYDFKSKIPTDIVGSVKIINMMTLCSKKEKLVIGQNITKKRENNELPCLICK